MYNFSKENVYPHKNDKIFYVISNQTTIFKIYVTKIYKIVQIINSNEFIFDFQDFIFILISGFSKKNICSKFGIKKRFRFQFERTKFKIFNRSQHIFDISYKMSNIFIKTNINLFYSYIINSKYLKHIDNKKHELNHFITNSMQIRKNKQEFIIFIYEMFQMNTKHVFLEVFQTNNKQFIYMVLAYVFFKQ